MSDDPLYPLLHRRCIGALERNPFASEMILVGPGESKALIELVRNLREEVAEFAVNHRQTLQLLELERSRAWCAESALAERDVRLERLVGLLDWWLGQADTGDHGGDNSADTCAECRLINATRAALTESADTRPTSNQELKTPSEVRDYLDSLDKTDG